jgi:hypothetical protein
LPRAGRSATSSAIFAFVLAVEIQVVRAEAKLGRDIDNGAERRLLCDLDVGRYVAKSPPIVLVSRARRVRARAPV